MQGLEESSPLGWGDALEGLVLQDLKGLGDLLHPKGPLGGEEDVQGAPVPLCSLAAEVPCPSIRVRMTLREPGSIWQAWAMAFWLAPLWSRR